MTKKKKATKVAKKAAKSGGSLRCSKIRDDFAKRPVDATSFALLKQIQMLQPLWLLTTQTWAKHLKTPPEKLAQHEAAIESAFAWMADWRAGTKIVKKNQNAVDSAISFVSNSAENRKVSDLFLSPVASNAAGCLRTCLHVATFNYDDSDLPDVIACDIFELAAVRTLFPFDTDNFVHFAPDSIHGVGADIDNYNAMLEIGSRELGLENELEALKAEAQRLWSNFDDPQPMEIPKGFENFVLGNFNQQLANQARKDFCEG